MKNTKRNQLRRVARAPGQVVSVRNSLESKLLKVCADIGWICGWREERLEPAPAARPSSRKRVMLGRALAAEAKMHESETFRPVEATFVSSRRTARTEAEPVVEASGLAEFAIDLHDEVARLGRMGISAGEVAGALSSARARAVDRQLWEQRRFVP